MSQKLFRVVSLGLFCTVNVVFLTTCSFQSGGVINYSPKNFKLLIPYEISEGGIVISTQWGAMKHRMYLDNHSPTWANEDVINDNLAIRKTKIGYQTTTADGTQLKGDVFKIDSIMIGGITFTNVPFYNISSDRKNLNGAIGENIFTVGIWKFDFKNKIITFTSDIDSIDGLTDTRLLKTRFSRRGIDIVATFRNNVKEDIQLDLGYNLSILMPPKPFSRIVRGNENKYTKRLQFSTPGNSQEVETTHAMDSLKLQMKYYKCTISSNEFVKEALLGRAFMEQFEFIILDYINKRVYISTSRL